MNPEPIVAISALEHHVYCPRQCALIHVEQLWLESEHTVRGELGHRRADSGEHRRERGHVALRAIPLWSEALGLTGRADVIEVEEDGAVVPVELKMGTRHRDAAHVQLCAQALCLEEMTGRSVTEGAIWLAGPRRRLRVRFDVVLRNRTVEVISEVRAWLAADRLPPAVDDERCTKCQLVDLCLPGACAHPRQVTGHLERRVYSCES